MSFHLNRISAHEMATKAAGVRALPTEQSPAWDAFEERVRRKVFGRYEFQRDGKTLALISLSEYSVRGFKFLWAKKGPIWLRSQTPENEAAFRRALRVEVKRRDRQVAFVRLHAKYSAPDLQDILSTISYDRTVLIDTCGGDYEKMLQNLPKDGRRSLKRSFARVAEFGATAKDLTNLDFEQFKQVYRVFQETATRNGICIHPIEVYWNMLDALRPNHARLFAVSYQGAIMAWVLIVLNDKQAATYYGAHSSQGREMLASEFLDFWSALELGKEGVESVDLMGIDSTRFPQLYELGIYKRRFSHEVTEVDGAWDMPISNPIYSALQLAKRGRALLLASKALTKTHTER